MIVTLTGENSFALSRELSSLLATFTAEHGDLAVEKLDGAEAEAADIGQALTSLPFLSSRKLVVLYQAGMNKEFTEQAEGLIKNLPESTDLIIVEPKPDKRLSYYKLLKSKTDLREFINIDPHQLTRWLVDQAKSQGATLTSADARYLVERVGANQQLLFNELNKLVLYDPKINLQTIDLLTEPNTQSTVFQLLEAAFSGETKKALRLYADQRAQKIEPPQIVAMLTWQLHVLAIVKAAGDRTVENIAKEANINPFVVRKTQTIARNLNMAEIRKLVEDLIYIDVSNKTRSIDADEALQNYLLSLSYR